MFARSLGCGLVIHAHDVVGSGLIYLCRFETVTNLSVYFLLFRVHVRVPLECSLLCLALMLHVSHRIEMRQANQKGLTKFRVYMRMTIVLLCHLYLRNYHWGTSH
jgi:hypothetical protein